MFEKKITPPLRIALIYLLFGVLWILVTDKVVEKYIPKEDQIAYETAKGWVFVAATAALIFFSLRRELTLRAATEEKLAETASNYRLLFESNPQPMWVYDLKTLGFLLVNDAAVNHYGYSRSEFMKMTIQDIRPPEETPALLDNVKQETAPIQRSGSWKHRRKDGTVFDVEITSHVLQIGGYDARLVLANDVTEKMLAEEALKASEDRLYSVLQAAPDAMIIFNEKREVIIVNTQATSIFGYAREELIGRSIEILIPERYRTMHADLEMNFVRTPRHRSDPSLEIYALRKDGSEFPAEINLNFHQFKNELFIIASIRDLTERKEAEEYIRYQASLLENVSDAIISTDLKFNITSWNPAAENIYGWRAGEVMGRSIVEVLQTDYESESQDNVLRQFQEKGIWRGEAIQVRKDGSKIIVLASVSVVKDEKGEPAAIVAVNRDITLRKQAEDEVRETRAIFQEIFTMSPVAIALSRISDRTIIDVNSALENLLGFTRAELVGTPSTTIDYWADPQERQLAFETLLRSNDLQGYEFLFKTKSGRVGQALNYTKILEMSGEKYFLSTFVDITERKQAEQALKVSEENYRSLSEASESAIAVLDREGRILYANPSSIRVWNDPQVVGKTIFELYPPDYAERYIHAIRQVIDTQQGIVDDVESLINGRLMWFRISMTPLKSSDGSVDSLLLNAWDDTERKQSEESLQRSEQRFRVLFENTPIAIWEEDFSEVKKNIDRLKETGITDLRAYFGAHPQEVPRFGRMARILDLNKAALEMYDAENKEELIRFIIQSLGEEESATSYEYLIAISEGKTTNSWEGQDKTMSGRVIDVNMTWSVFPGYEQDYSRIIFITRDITERKRAENELRESKERYRTLFEDVPVAIWEEDFSQVRQYLDALKAEGVTDFRTYFEEHSQAVIEGARKIKILDANRAALTMYEAKEKEELIQDTSQELSKGELEHLHEDLIAIAEGRLKNTWDGADRTFTDKPIEISLNWSVVPGHEEDYSKVIITTMDITERKRAEEELRASEERFRQLAENIEEAFWLTDPATREEIYLSPATAKIWGYSVEEIMKKPEIFVESVLPEDQYIVREALAKQMEGEQTDIEYRIQRPDGSICWVSDRAFPIMDENGRVRLVAGLSADITERKLADEKIKLQLQRLRGLSTIDNAINNSHDMRLTLHIFLKEVLSQLHVDAADIYLLNPFMQSLEFISGEGFRTKNWGAQTLRVGYGLAGRSVLQRKLIHTPDLSNEVEFSRASLNEQEGFTTYFGLPLIVKGKIKGMMEVFHRSPLDPDPEWLDYLDTLAGQAAIAIESAQLFEGLQRSNLELTMAYDATIEGWSHALDLRDKETEGHSQRVTEWTIQLAKRLGISEQELVHVRRGALLHDIGKLGVPDPILLKPGKLTEEEWEIMRQHPKYAYDMLAPIVYLRQALDIPYCHHEKWDGSGYPRGLKGEQIPLAARIFAIVDVWDALSSDRPYRAGWAPERIREYLLEQSGTHFDPRVVVEFLKLLDERFQ